MIRCIELHTDWRTANDTMASGIEASVFGPVCAHVQYPIASVESQIPRA